MKKEQPKVAGFTWKPGTSHKVEAEVAAAEIQRLFDENGQRIPAEKIVEVAESPLNPLHPEFDWNDQVAAREHRLLQARNLLNALVVMVPRPKGPPMPTRWTVTVEQPGTGGRKRDYTPMMFALKDVNLRAEVLRTALLELAAFKRKYADLSELAQVIAVIDRTVRKTKVA